MSGLFQTLEGEIAVVYENGVYKECSVAVRNSGELYVKAKGGFVRLYADGSTSGGSKMKLDTITVADPLFKDRFGRLCIGEAEHRKPLTEEPTYLTIEKDQDT